MSAAALREVFSSCSVCTSCLRVDYKENKQNLTLIYTLVTFTRRYIVVRDKHVQDTRVPITKDQRSLKHYSTPLFIYVSTVGSLVNLKPRTTTRMKLSTNM